MIDTPRHIAIARLSQRRSCAELAELGRIVKTILLCRYLAGEAFRREIHDGLNVEESWNGTNGFIFFGKGSEIASNWLEDQRLSVRRSRNKLDTANAGAAQAVRALLDSEDRLKNKDKSTILAAAAKKRGATAAIQNL